MDKQLNSPKKCNTSECDKAWIVVPKTARYGGNGPLKGWYWECNCGSTMFLPKDLKKLEEIRTKKQKEEK